jgi:hypothetical protein
MGENYIPGYWMNETSGVLRPAVLAYLETDQEPSLPHIGALRAYFRQWINAPFRGPDVIVLRLAIDALDSRQAIDRWLSLAEEIGVDPL